MQVLVIGLKQFLTTEFFFDGLGILEGSFCPHYDSDDEYKHSYDRWAKDKIETVHYRLNDNETLHIQNGKIVAKIIANMEGTL